jgi:hypothetical protein
MSLPLLFTAALWYHKRSKCLTAQKCIYSVTAYKKSGRRFYALRRCIFLIKLLNEVLNSYLSTGLEFYKSSLWKISTSNLEIFVIERFKPVPGYTTCHKILCTCRKIVKNIILNAPREGGLECFHRSPASLRKGWKGNPVPKGINRPPCHLGDLSQGPGAPY